MKIVLDNIIFSLQTCGGISGMFSRLVSGLQRAPGVELFAIERDDATRNIFRQQIDIAASQIIRATGPLRLDRYTPVSPSLIPFDEPFIFHSSYYRYCRHPKAIGVTTLHDFTYEVMRLYGWLPTLVHSRQKNQALRHSRAVACVSHATLSDFRRLLPSTPGQIVEVIPNAPLCTPRPEAAPSTRRNRDVLFVGARAYNKNFSLLVDALVDTDWRLVLCSSTLTPDELSRLERKLQPGQWEIHVFPDDDALSRIYSRSHCLVYPSSYEGFGIPIIEAQEHGLPVVTGPCPASVEIGGGAAIVMDDYTPEALRTALQRLRDPQVCTTLAEQGRANAARYRWDEIVAAYLRLYSSGLRS